MELTLEEVKILLAALDMLQLFVGVLVGLYVRRTPMHADSRPVVMVTGRQHTQLPWMDDSNEIEIREVKYELNRPSR